MARQPKRGLDYAPWDVNWMSDPDIDKLADSQGGAGILVYHYLCMMAYGSDGYFYKWSYDNAATTARRMGLGIGSETVKQTVATCFRIGLFDKRLFEEESVLTSKGIQRRYAEAIQKRSYKTVNRNIWLLDDEESKGLGITCQNSGFLPENADFLPENSDSLPENSIKEKESKVKNNIGSGGISVIEEPDQQAPTPTDPVLQQIISEWNAIPHTVNIDNIIPMTHRYDELRVCMHLVGTDGVMKAIRKVRESAYLKRRGSVTFDNYINRNAIQKLIEGSYDKDLQKEARKETVKKTAFNDFHQREYDWEEMNRKFFNK